MEAAPGDWEGEQGKFVLTTNQVNFEYGFAIMNAAGKVLYEIGGAESPIWGAMCKDAQMYGSYWNRVMVGLKLQTTGPGGAWCRCAPYFRRPSTSLPSVALRHR